MPIPPTSTPTPSSQFPNPNVHPSTSTSTSAPPIQTSTSTSPPPSPSNRHPFNWIISSLTTSSWLKPLLPIALALFIALLAVQSLSFSAENIPHTTGVVASLPTTTTTTTGKGWAQKPKREGCEEGESLGRSRCAGFGNEDVGGNSKMAASSKIGVNVFGKPLSLFSKSPMTGFYRNGYCDVGPDDGGVHAIAAEITDEFLAFSASRGNDLRIIGLKGGCKWCLCVNRWREAMQAAKGPDDPVVPKVFLSATHQKALERIKMEDLEKFAAPES